MIESEELGAYRRALALIERTKTPPPPYLFLQFEK